MEKLKELVKLGFFKQMAKSIQRQSKFLSNIKHKKVVEVRPYKKFKAKIKAKEEAYSNKERERVKITTVQVQLCYNHPFILKNLHER